MLASLEPTPLYGPACAILIALSKKELLKNFGPLCQTIGSMNHLHLLKITLNRITCQPKSSDLNGL
jgi:hypothetical protein